MLQIALALLSISFHISYYLCAVMTCNFKLCLTFQIRKCRPKRLESRHTVLISCSSGLASKKGKSRVFYDQHEEYGGIAVVSLGKQNAGYNELEELDEGRENVRTAVARGVKQLQDAGIKSIDVEPCGDPEGRYLLQFILVFLALPIFRIKYRVGILL